MRSGAFLFLCFLALAYSHTEGHNHEERPGGWCGTRNHIHNNRSLSKRAVGCGWGTRCEAPEVRDTYQTSKSQTQFVVRLKFIIFGYSAINPTITQNVAALMDTTTKAYAGSKISFEYSINVNPSTEYNGLDPSQTDRVTRMKKATADSTGTQLNIWVPQTLKQGLLGWAIFPIDSQEALSVSGGVVMTWNEVNSGKWTLPHEMGHAFGLLHTHESSAASGGSAAKPCDVCAEFAGSPSDVKGDLISDTPPTYENYKCAEPTGTDCQNRAYGKTDFYNIMGYAPNSCLSQAGRFSAQQTGRMRCFLERNLGGWLSTARKCSTVADCEDNNACTFETCVNGGCVTRLTRCDNASVPCVDNTCDPRDGQCKTSPRVCTAPPSLPCARAACDTKEDRCLTDFTACAPPDSFSNDCCATSRTPFCKDSSIINCACSKYSLNCCTEDWDELCTRVVAHCSETRDCVAEKLPPPTNTFCAKALPVEDGASILFKSDATDNSSFSCLGVDVNIDGGWWAVHGGDYSSVSIDTCFVDTAVVPTIYVFNGNCPQMGGVCTTKAISGSSCTAQLTVTIEPDQALFFFIGSLQTGTIRADFKATSVGGSGASLPIGAIIALVVLSIFAFLVIGLIIYMLTQKGSYKEVP